MYDAQFGKKRISFKTQETGDKSLSTFTQYPDSISPGAVLYGEITEKTTGGRTYYNFNFVKKGAAVQNSPNLPEYQAINVGQVYNLVNLKVLPKLDRIVTLLTGKVEDDKMDDSWPPEEV